MPGWNRLVNQDQIDAMESVINRLSNLAGQLSDLVGIPYVAGDNSIMAHLNTNFLHVHGTPFVYPDKENSVVLTSGNGAWDIDGAIVEVIPAGVMAADFDLHWININAISANSQFIVDFYAGEAGDEVWIGGTDSHRNAVQSQEGAKRVQIAQQPAGTRISCKLSDSTAGQITCGVKFDGHYYV